MLAFTPSFALDIARLAAMRRKRDERGSDWCSLHGLGRWRKDIDAEFLIPIAQATDIDRAYALGLENGRAALACFCKACPLHCDLKDK